MESVASSWNIAQKQSKTGLQSSTRDADVILSNALYIQTRSWQQTIARPTFLRLGSGHFTPLQQFHEPQTHPENRSRAGPHNMAIARCETCGPPKGMKQAYSNPHTVILETRSRDRRILCGATNCSRVAMVWLTDAEEAEYRRGLRGFRVLHHSEVRVK
jgi:hypothetical protein